MPATWNPDGTLQVLDRNGSVVAPSVPANVAPPELIADADANAADDAPLRRRTDYGDFGAPAPEPPPTTGSEIGFLGAGRYSAKAQYERGQTPGAAQPGKVGLPANQQYQGAPPPAPPAPTAKTTTAGTDEAALARPASPAPTAQAPQQQGYTDVDLAIATRPRGGYSPGRPGGYMPGNMVVQKAAPIDDSLKLQMALSAQNQADTAVIAAQDLQEQYNKEAQAWEERQAQLKAREAEIQAQQKKAEELTAPKLKKLEALARDIEDDKIDPNQYWADKGFFGKLLAVVSISLGAGVQAMKGGSNIGLDIVRKNIDDNIAAQKANMENKRAAYDAQMASIKAFRDQWMSPEAADNAMRAINTQQALVVANQMAASAKSEEVKANAEMLASGLKSDLNKYMTEIARAEAGTIQQSFQYQKPVAGGYYGGATFDSEYKRMQKLFPDKTPEEWRRLTMSSMAGRPVNYGSGGGLSPDAEAEAKARMALTARGIKDKATQDSILAKSGFDVGKNKQETVQIKGVATPVKKEFQKEATEVVNARNRAMQQVAVIRNHMKKHGITGLIDYFGGAHAQGETQRKILAAAIAKILAGGFNPSVEHEKQALALVPHPNEWAFDTEAKLQELERQITIMTNTALQGYTPEGAGDPTAPTPGARRR